MQLFTLKSFCLDSSFHLEIIFCVNGVLLLMMMLQMQKTGLGSKPVSSLEKKSKQKLHSQYL